MKLFWIAAFILTSAICMSMANQYPHESHAWTFWAGADFGAAVIIALQFIRGNDNEP